jgi:hypothetical protein
MKCPDSLVFWNLHRYGAPLVNHGSSGKKLSLEETVSLALLLARRRPDVARVLPVVLMKNKGRLDFERLREASSHFGQSRALGFFLDLTGKMTGDPKMSSESKSLMDRAASFEYFFTLPRWSRALKLAVERTPDLTKTWRFWMNASVESFESCLRKFMVARA